MSSKRDSNLNLEGLSDAEIYRAIRYLDPTIDKPDRATTKNNTLVFSVGLLVLLLGLLGLALLNRSVNSSALTQSNPEFSVQSW